MNKPQQIAFNLTYRSAMGREDFMITPSNEAAVGWIDRWPDWPAPALIIYGPEAAGKTHLGAVWQEKSSQQFIDDIEQLIGNPEEEEQIFHSYNIAKEEGKSLLLAASSSPQNWQFVLPDLASRLKAAPSVEIAPPDDTLLAAMLLKLFRDRQQDVKEEVIQFILPRIERSYNAARKLVEQADHAALSKKQGITIPIVSKFL